jgi:hypothetical protein
MRRNIASMFITGGGKPPAQTEQIAAGERVAAGNASLSKGANSSRAGPACANADCASSYARFA